MSKYIYSSNENGLNNFENNFYNKKKINEHPQKPYFDYLSSILTTEKSFFEIGFGFGRIFNFVKNNVKEYVGIEPDVERFKSSQKLLKYNIDKSERFQFFNYFSNDYIKHYPDKKFDIVCISHVIQHVSTQTALNIIKDAFKLLNDNGTLIISTTCAPRELFTYEKLNISDTVNNFNYYCLKNETNKGLPVHMFTKESLLVYLQNFEIKYYEQYQFIKPDKLEWFSNNFYTSKNEITNIGQSQFVVCKKKN